MSHSRTPHGHGPSTEVALRRAGIGVVLARVASAVPDPPVCPWSRLESVLTGAIAGMLWNDFLMVEYDPPEGTPDVPAAWVRTGPRGVQCALQRVAGRSAAATHGPAEFTGPWCPAERLRSWGWDDPTAPGRPWTCGPCLPRAAARSVLAGMRSHRACGDPYEFHWGVGSLPAPEITASRLLALPSATTSSPTPRVPAWSPPS
ncbi:hypothetical protein ACW9PK_02665 [Kocuria sp. MNB10]